MEKDFTEWHAIKKNIHGSKSLPTFQEREVWWCSLGANVGHEEDGKGLYFRRPVLVIKRFNRNIFWGLPLTTQLKDKSYYHRIFFKDMEQCVMLSQLRLLASNRLGAKMGKLDFEQYKTIIKKLQDTLEISRPSEEGHVVPKGKL